MDYSMVKKLAGWFYPKSSGQELSVWMEISEEQYLQGVCDGTSTV